MSFHRRQSASERASFGRSPASPMKRRTDPISELQQGLGNGGVQRLLMQTMQRQAIQRERASEEGKLQMKANPSQAKAIQRERASASEEKELQMKADPSQAKSSSGGASGVGLPDGVRQRMESAIGADFSDVRIHEGSRATEVGALAYTQGNDIHFAPGQYDPGSRKGQELLGHELTHVVQQRQGRVKPTGSVGGMPLNDDKALESEADRMGAKAAGESGRSTAL